MKALKLEDNNIIDIDIDNTLEAFQTAVDGHIETVGIVPGIVVMVVNEEGLLRGMAQNNIASLVARRYIVGPALIVGVDEEDFTDVPAETAQWLKDKYL